MINLPRLYREAYSVTKKKTFNLEVKALTSHRENHLPCKCCKILTYHKMNPHRAKAEANVWWQKNKIVSKSVHAQSPGEQVHKTTSFSFQPHIFFFSFFFFERNWSSRAMRAHANAALHMRSGKQHCSHRAGRWRPHPWCCKTGLFKRLTGNITDVQII